MPNRSKSRGQGPPDPNLLAFDIVQQATGQKAKEVAPSSNNVSTVTLGRLGGLKGGKARAESLTPDKRKAIAKKAAQARWATKESSD